MDTQPDVAIYQRIRSLQARAWRADRGQRVRIYGAIAASTFAAGGIAGYLAALFMVG